MKNVIFYIAYLQLLAAVYSLCDQGGAAYYTVNLFWGQNLVLSLCYIKPSELKFYVYCMLFNLLLKVYLNFGTLE